MFGTQIWFSIFRMPNVLYRFRERMAGAHECGVNPLRQRMFHSIGYRAEVSNYCLVNPCCDRGEKPRVVISFSDTSVPFGSTICYLL